MKKWHSQIAWNFHENDFHNKTALRRCSYKKVLWKNVENLQENT